MAVDICTTSYIKSKTYSTIPYNQCFQRSKKEAGSLLQSKVEYSIRRNFLSENGEFWCIIGGILCDLELQEETRYRPG